ncbi:ABC-type transport auxiliary lipoprotein family protein [Parerythrobacter aestuarii]|uniref:ABC-type transport auxiliary lipoprotein family protein n=1 Tax=Parerythrobacter aestuarii TaxID=3020909 RepID=UPI0024DE554A|nr:ABC-type transport auxiliary lipoprotein family protein [Parerythrobacter aestuarii]
MHSTLVRTAIVPLAALTLAGCVSFGGEAPPSLISLTADLSAPAGSGATGTAEDALTVLEPNAPARLAVTRVPVQVDDATVAYLKDAVWVEKPTRLFRRLLSETISSKTGRVVLDGLDPTFPTSDKVRGTLVEFGYDARSSSVIVRFDAIRENADDSITTRRFESIVPGVEAEVGPVGDALNRAANDVAGQVADWLGE